MISRLFFISFFIFSFLPALSIDRNNIPSLESKNIDKSIIHHKAKLDSKRGPIQINILEIDLSDPLIEIVHGLSSDEVVMSRSTLSSIASKYNALAAINSNYFNTQNGTLLGLAKKDGKWITGSIYNRAAISFFEKNRTKISKQKLLIDLKSHIDVLRTNIYVGCFNTPREVGMSICLYDSLFQKTIYSDKGDDIAVIKDKCVVSINSTPVTLDKNDYALVGKNLRSILSVGTCFDFSWISEPDINDSLTVFSGGPLLLMNGIVFVDDVEERLVFKGNNTHAPRTAIGTDYNNKLYLIVVDGRQDDFSVGMSLEELAFFLKVFGLKDAINLDGGGSTSMYLNGKIINSPSDSAERKISNAIIVRKK